MLDAHPTKMGKTMKAKNPILFWDASALVVDLCKTTYSHTSAIEMFDSCAVGITAELLHGGMHIWEKKGEFGDPEVSQILPWPKSRPHLRDEFVVVVSHVPDEPQQVDDGAAGVAPPLPRVSCHFVLEHWLKTKDPGIANH